MNINYSAPVNTLSYGLVGLNVLMKMVEYGNDISWWPIGGAQAAPEIHDILKACQGNTATYSKYAPSLRVFHEFDLAQHIGKGKHVGWPIFEINRFNDVRRTHMANQDELVVCSGWAKQVCVDNGLILPIHVVPLGIDPSIFYPKQQIKNNYIGRTKFIHIGKREYRKSQCEMLQCFEKAFTPQDDVELTVVWGSELLKYIMPEEHDRWTSHFLKSKMASKIKLVEFLPTQKEIADLLRLADCGLFLSKSEGFNLGLLECIAVGTQAIATNRSGHTQFINGANCNLVDMNNDEPIFDGVWFKSINGEDGTWGAFEQDQEDQVIYHMREIHNTKQNGYSTFNKPGVQTGALYTWENTVLKLLEVLK